MRQDLSLTYKNTIDSELKLLPPTQKSCQLMHGDCLELMPKLPDHSVELILCDLPYGVTSASWDAVIPFDKMWAEYKRILVPHGNVVLFSAQPFTTKLIHSNFKAFSYCWVWIKNQRTNFQNAKKMPIRRTEDICVFSWYGQQKADNTGAYEWLRNYMFDELHKSGKTRSEMCKLLGNYMPHHYWTRGGQFSIPSKKDYEKLQEATGCFNMPYARLYDLWVDEMPVKPRLYFPQGVRTIKPKRKHRKGCILYGESIDQVYTQTVTGYPNNVLEFPREVVRFHPTQKPVELLRYLIRTYTQEGMTVLDNCMGSGSTGVAAIMEKRKFIGMELNQEFFEFAQKRINEISIKS